MPKAEGFELVFSEILGMDRQDIVVPDPFLRLFTAERRKEFERRFPKESVQQIADDWGKSANMIRNAYKKSALAKLRRKPRR